MAEREEALKVLDFIKGTAIADLDTLVAWVKAFKGKDKEKVTQPVNGRLNFTVAMISLVICETCGCYMLGASEHLKPQSDRDVGTYMIQFMDKYFLKDGFFKKFSKVLADFLRHSLIHSFGSYTSPQVNFQLALAISTNLSLHAAATEEEGKRKITVNSLSLAEQTLQAFKKFQAEVEKGDSQLIDNILKTKNLNLDVGNGITKQFDVMFKELTKEK
jgi:hypothetical protein